MLHFSRMVRLLLLKVYTIYNIYNILGIYIYRYVVLNMHMYYIVVLYISKAAQGKKTENVIILRRQNRFAMCRRYRNVLLFILGSFLFYFCNITSRTPALPPNHPIIIVPRILWRLWSILKFLGWWFGWERFCSCRYLGAASFIYMPPLIFFYVILCTF